MSDGCEICETIIDDQISFTPHTATNKSRRHTIHVLDLIPESVTGGFMSSPMPPKSLEVNVTEIVFHRYGIRLNDIRNLRFRISGLRKPESRTVYIISKRHDVDAFSVLRNSVILTIENLIQRSIPHIFQSLDDNLERIALVMDGQSFNVLTKYDLRLMIIADSDYIEE